MTTTRRYKHRRTVITCTSAQLGASTGYYLEWPNSPWSRPFVEQTAAGWNLFLGWGAHIGSPFPSLGDAARAAFDFFAGWAGVKAKRLNADMKRA